MKIFVYLKKTVLACLVYGLGTMVALAAASEELIPGAFVKSLLKEYSDSEKRVIELDLRNITETCFWEKKPTEGQPTYVATAGGPGASKSTILETFLQGHPHFVYADPDPRALRLMINTYYQSLTYYNISQASTDLAALESAYKKWRAASNYIACIILNDAFEQGYNIAHGTTSTAKEVEGMYNRLKGKNYKIILLLCGSTDQNRIKSIQNRATTQGFVQSTAEDIVSKGTLFPQRFPIYFKYADEIEIYWTEDFTKGSVKAATFSPHKGISVLNQEAYDRFVNEYEKNREKHKELPPFTKLISTQGSGGI